MPRQLKVYRTPIGFHDAYVAAPSQKAALDAWGSDANLFARGVAEVVTDPALTREPLASPGTVVRRPRGTADEHFAALPKTKAAPKPKASHKAASAVGAEAPSPSKSPARPAKPRPRPSRAALDAAEQVIAAVQRQQGEERAALRRREEELARERRAVERRHARDTVRLEEQRDRARKAYDRALAKWSR